MRFGELIVCEDIRREEQNKLSLMGVLGDLIFVDPRLWMGPPGAPPALRLGFCIRFWLEPQDPVPNGFTFRVSLNGRPIGEVEGTMAIERPERAVQVAFALPAVPIQQPGTLTCVLRVKQGDRVVGEHEMRALAIEAQPAAR